MNKEHDPYTWKLIFVTCWAFVIESVIPFGIHVFGTALAAIVSYLIFCRFKNWAQKKAWWDKYFKHS